MAANPTAKDYDGEKVSQRICSHMNEDHAVTVYAMAKQRLDLKKNWKLSNAILKKVTVDGCSIQAVVCNGETLCQLREVFYPFQPALSCGLKSLEVRKRLIQIHNCACGPQWHWLVTRFSSAIILAITVVIGYGTLILELDELDQVIVSVKEHGFPTIPILSEFFDESADFTLAQVVRWSFWLLVVVHTVEASYAAYCCKQQLKLNAVPVMKWFILILLVGFPIFQDLQLLLKKNKEHHATKKNRN